MKYSTLFILISLTLISCQSIEKAYDKSVDGIKTLTENINNKQYEKEKDSENWDLNILDTALAADYLSNIEKNVILEMNKVRTDPVRYSDLYIKPRLKQYSNNKELFINGKTYITNEGKKAVEECIAVLNKTKKMDILKPNPDLYQLALDHVNKQGPTGLTGHESPNGDNFNKRIKNTVKNSKIMGFGENISYGDIEARDIVISLLIDDGVPSRGHRKNILTNKFNITGVSLGKHKQYGKMCVIDFGNLME